jgi:hypothetical protein
VNGSGKLTFTFNALAAHINSTYTFNVRVKNSAGTITKNFTSMTLTVRDCLAGSVTSTGGSIDTAYLIEENNMPDSTTNMDIPSYTIQTTAHQKACQLSFDVSITTGNAAKYIALLDTEIPSASWKLFNSPT